MRFLILKTTYNIAMRNYFPKSCTQFQKHSYTAIHTIICCPNSTLKIKFQQNMLQHKHQFKLTQCFCHHHCQHESTTGNWHGQKSLLRTCWWQVEHLVSVVSHFPLAVGTSYITNFNMPFIVVSLFLSAQARSCFSSIHFCQLMCVSICTPGFKFHW